MFAQDNNNGIKKPTMGDNVVIKLHMDKAYYKVSLSLIISIK